MRVTSDLTPISYLSGAQGVFSEWTLNAFHSNNSRIRFQHEYDQKDR